MKKIFRNIMMLMTVPFMLMTSACESMDDTNVDPTRMNTANAGSFWILSFMVWALTLGPDTIAGLSS